MAKRTCTVEGCEKPLTCQGLCPMHLYRLKRYGDPLGGGPFQHPHTDHCSVDGCQKPPRTRGLCDMHYRRLLHQGHPLTTLILTCSLREKFDFWTPDRPADGCWPWKGGLSSTGYGVLTKTGLNISAHRYAYMVFVGPIADDLVPDHLCHTNDPTCFKGDDCPHRRCCNPTHLEAVSPSENSRRQHRPPRR